MAQQRGAYTPIIIGTQSTFSAAATVGQKLYYKSESLKYNRNLISSETLRGSRQPIRPMRGNVDVAGDLVTELGPEHGKLLKHAFGTYGITGGSAPYTHKFTIGDLPAGLTVEKQFVDLTAANKYFMYTGCKVNTFKLSMKTEGVIEATFSLMGRGEAIGTSSFDASPTDLGLLPFDGFGGALYIGDHFSEVSVAICTAIDLTLENGLDGNSYVIGGAGARRWLPEGIAKVSGTLTLLFEDPAFYIDAVNFAEKSLRLELVNGTGVGNTAGNEKMTLYLPELVFKPEAPAVTGPNGVTFTSPFEAFYYNDSEASAMYAEILSATADYDV
jgi:hypothetical protein